jgi:hypothetical protein
MGAVSFRIYRRNPRYREHMAEGISVVAPKVSDRLEVRLQMAQQPDHLDIAMGRSLQPAARPHPVQIAVNVKLQQIGGRVARAACHLALATAGLWEFHGHTSRRVPIGLRQLALFL